MKTKKVSRLEKITKELAKDSKFLKRTNILEKAGASLLNAIFVFIIASPFYFYLGWSFMSKVSTIVIFFVVTLVSHFVFGGRCIGMRILKTHWGKKYGWLQNGVYSILYTLSFSTLFIWIYFPLDLFLLNMILQAVTILITGTTIHGFLSGQMHTVKHKK